MKLNIIILAAGQGTRMHSAKPKVLHELAGKPILQWIVDTALQLHPDNIYIVYGFGGEQVKAAIEENSAIVWVEQKEQLGTGHAVAQVLPHLNDNEQVLILVGDTPLIQLATLRSLVNLTKDDHLALLTVNFADPTGLGRIIRNAQQQVVAIIEDKDATAEQRKITEINTGIMAMPTKHLKKYLPQLKNNNQQKEYYLTDIMALAVQDHQTIVATQPENPEEVLSVNNRLQLAELERYYQKSVAEKLMLQGVTMRDPNRFDLRGELICGKDVTIDINVIIEGKVIIGNNVVIEANVILRNTTIKDNAVIHANSHIDSAIIGENCQIGPFARIRPGTQLAHDVKIGNFVETKKALIDVGSKVNHLSYIGDATIGKDVNIGAGVITCNYDGVNKHQTIIEDNAFIGSDSQLVAPVTVEKGAYIGSGSTISKTAPAGKLTLARARQTTIDKWQPPKKSK